MKGILLNSILLYPGGFALLCVRGNAHVVHAGFFDESWKLPVEKEVEQEKKISFMNDIAPIFVQHCQGCHGPEKSKGGFRLDTFHHLTKDDGASNTLFVSGGSPGRGGWIVSFDLDHDNPSPHVLLQKSETIWCIQLVQAQEGPLQILAGCSDGSVVQLDAVTGDVIQDYPLHADWVLKMDFRPESGRLATASRDHTARVIDVSNWTQVSAWRGASQPVSGVVWLPDGKSLVSVGPGSGLDRWDAESADRKGKRVNVKAQWPQLWVVPNALWAVSDAVDCVQIDPTNLNIKNRFQLDASRGRILSLSGSREHDVMALGHTSGVVTILDTCDGKELVVIQPFPGNSAETWK